MGVGGWKSGGLGDPTAKCVLLGGGRDFLSEIEA